DGVLSNRLLEVRHLRVAQEALHFHGDLPLVLLRGQQLLRPEGDIHVLLPPLDVERIVGDRPSILDQGTPHLVAIPIACRHGTILFRLLAGLHGSFFDPSYRVCLLLGSFDQFCKLMPACWVRSIGFASRYWLLS